MSIIIGLFALVLLAAGTFASVTATTVSHDIVAAVAFGFGVTALALSFVLEKLSGIQREIGKPPQYAPVNDQTNREPASIEEEASSAIDYETDQPMRRSRRR